MTDHHDDALLFDSGRVSYAVNGREVWRFSADEMILAAEWTNDHGPWCDDYFYLFLASRPLFVYEAPVCTNVRFLEDLAKHLSSSIEAGLAHCTDFNSRVMWPPELAGKALFQYRRERREPGLLNRVRDSCWPLIRSELTPEIATFVREHEADEDSG